jgi:hypothetical protein
MNMPIEARNGHEQQRTTPTRDSARLSGGHLAGLRHLQELSLAAHPLEKDQTVAQAWG